MRGRLLGGQPASLAYALAEVTRGRGQGLEDGGPITALGVTLQQLGKRVEHDHAALHLQQAVTEITRCHLVPSPGTDELPPLHDDGQGHGLGGVGLDPVGVQAVGRDRRVVVEQLGDGRADIVALVVQDAALGIDARHDELRRRPLVRPVTQVE